MGVLAAIRGKFKREQLQSQPLSGTGQMPRDVKVALRTMPGRRTTAEAFLPPDRAFDAESGGLESRFTTPLAASRGAGPNWDGGALRL